MKHRRFAPARNVAISGLLLFCLAMLLMASAGGAIGTVQTKWGFGGGGILFNTPQEACQALVDDVQGKGTGSQIKNDTSNPEIRSCYYIDKKNNNKVEYLGYVYIVVVPPGAETTPTPTPTPPPTPTPKPTPEALNKIAAFRARNRIPPQDVNLCERGTVALVNVGGRDFYGLNTTLEREYLKRDTAELRKAVLAELQRAGKLPGATYNRSGQFLTHAEAEALILARQDLGRLPQRLMMYVDRPTCNQCGGGAEKGLPLLAELYNIQELTVTDLNGRSLLIRAGQKTNPCL